MQSIVTHSTTSNYVEVLILINYQSLDVAYFFFWCLYKIVLSYVQLLFLMSTHSRSADCDCGRYQYRNWTPVTISKGSMFRNYTRCRSNTNIYSVEHLWIWLWIIIIVGQPIIGKKRDAWPTFHTDEGEIVGRSKNSRPSNFGIFIDHSLILTPSRTASKSSELTEIYCQI